MRSRVRTRRRLRDRVAFILYVGLLWLVLAGHVLRRRLLVAAAATLAVAVFSAAFIVSLTRGKGSSLARAT
jgi:hypothetical protein